VEGIAAHAEAGQLGVDLRAARPGMFVLFEHHDAGALAHDEAVAILVPGTGSSRRIVVARGQGLGRSEAAHGQRRHSRLGAAANHRVGIAVLDHPRRQADRVQARGAGRDHGNVGPLEAEHDRQVARDHVADGARNEEGRNLARTARQIVVVRILDHRQATDAGADVDADALGIGLRRVEPGVAQRLDAGRHAEMDEGIHPARFLRGQVGGDVEVLHFAGNLRLERRGIELRDAADPALSGKQVVPGFGNAIPNRRDKSQTGDDHTASRHDELRKKGLKRGEDYFLMLALT
jgi:hypothetical protein